MTTARTAVTIPAWLHDVFGERQNIAELTSTVCFAGVVTALLALEAPAPWETVSPWRMWLALVIIFDVAAGCAANFTRGTNDFYAARPRNRWLFIAIHVHLLAVRGFSMFLGGPRYLAGPTPSEVPHSSTPSPTIRLNASWLESCSPSA